ncbi:hypothetical protein C8R48DRAFT_812847 [Suillus tomentosus]|nr:hypothetical protein C8R48DRAFT_812847 [Suillus tomentosus]
MAKASTRVRKVKEPRKCSCPLKKQLQPPSGTQAEHPPSQEVVSKTKPRPQPIPPKKSSTLSAATVPGGSSPCDEVFARLWTMTDTYTGSMDDFFTAKNLEKILKKVKSKFLDDNPNAQYSKGKRVSVKRAIKTRLTLKNLQTYISVSVMRTEMRVSYCRGLYRAHMILAHHIQLANPGLHSDWGIQRVPPNAKVLVAMWWRIRARVLESRPVPIPVPQ